MTARPPLPALHPILNLLQRCWHAAIEPACSVQDPELRRKSRVFAGLLLIVTPAALLRITFDSTLKVGVFSFIGLFTVGVIAYLLNRRGKYLLGVLLILIYASLTPTIALHLNGTFSPMSLARNYIWTAVILIGAYLLLDVRGALAFIVFNLALIPAVSIFAPFDFQTVAYIYYFNVIVGVLVGAAAVIRHINARERAAQALELALVQDRQRVMFEAMLEAMFIHDNGVVVDLNPACERLMGVLRAEMIGRNVLDFIVPEHHARAQDQVSKGSDAIYEVQARRGDGSVFWAEVQGRSHYFNGRLMRVVSFRDIDMRRQGEEQRVELAVEREKVAVLQRFIGDISHDLKTPLSVMKTNAYLIRRLVNEPEKQAKQIETLEQQVDHLERALTDLLDMSRLDRADTSEFEFRWQSVNPIVSAVVDELREAALRKNQVLSLHMGEELPFVLMDSKEFRRMLKHLVANAVTYTPAGGKIDVIVAPCQEMLCIEVSDTGVGINPLDLPNVFERFYRGDQARSTKSGGVGLGLSIAKRIAEAHGASIEVESELGKGSVFRVRMPMRHPQPTGG